MILDVNLSLVSVDVATCCDMILITIAIKNQIVSSALLSQVILNFRSVLSVCILQL